MTEALQVKQTLAERAGSVKIGTVNANPSIRRTRILNKEILQAVERNREVNRYYDQRAANERDFIFRQILEVSTQNRTIINTLDNIRQNIFELTRKSVGKEMPVKKAGTMKIKPKKKPEDGFDILSTLLGVGAALASLKKLPGLIKNRIPALNSLLTRFASGFSKGGKYLKNISNTILSKASDFGVRLLAYAKSFGNSVLGFSKTFGSKVLGRSKEFGARLIKRIEPFFKRVYSNIEQQVTKILSPVTKLVKNIEESIRKTWNKFIIKPLKNISDNILLKTERFRGFISEFANTVLAKAKNFTDEVINLLRAGLSKIPFFSKIASTLGVGLAKGGEKVAQVGKAKGAAGGVLGKLKQFGQGAFSVAKGAFTGTQQAVTGTVQAGSRVARALANPAKFLGNFFPKVLKTMGPFLRKSLGAIKVAGLGPFSLLLGGGLTAYQAKKLLEQGKTPRQVALEVIPQAGGFIGGAMGATAGSALLPIPFLGTLVGALGGDYVGRLLTRQFTPQIADLLGFDKKREQNFLAKASKADTEKTRAKVKTSTAPRTKSPTEKIDIPERQNFSEGRPRSVDATREITKAMSEVSDARDAARRENVNRGQGSTVVTVPSTPQQNNQAVPQREPTNATSGDNSWAHNAWNKVSNLW